MTYQKKTTLEEIMRLEQKEEISVQHAEHKTTNTIHIYSGVNVFFITTLRHNIEQRTINWYYQ